MNTRLVLLFVLASLLFCATFAEETQGRLRSLLSRRDEDADEFTEPRQLFFKKIAKGVKKTAKKAAKAVKKTAKKTVKTVKKTTTKATKSVTKVAKKTTKTIGSVAKNTGKKIGNVAKDVAKDAGTFVGIDCPKNGQVLGGVCSAFCSCGTFSKHKFPMFCEPLTHKCKRDHPCDFLGGKDARLDTKRIAAENRYASLYEQFQNVKQYMNRMEMRRETPAEAKLKEMGKIRRDMLATKREAESLLRQSKNTKCGKLVGALNGLKNLLDKAIDEVVDFIEEHQCFLVSAGFTVAGIAGDTAFDALTGGGSAAREAEPICANLLTGKLQDIFQGKKKDGKVPTSKSASVLTALTVVQATACVVRDEYGVDTEIIEKACVQGDVALSLIKIVLNIYCANPGSAVAEIFSIAVECSIGCNNGFCPK